MFLKSSLYQGTVFHQRITPVRHKLSYSVYSLFIDLDEINELDKQIKLFSHNRWNLLSLYDRDYGDGGQTDLAKYARAQLADKLPELEPNKTMLLTYPRVLGYVFNPLSVYVFFDEHQEPIAAIYEVSNTFSGRTNYICKIQNGKIDQAEKDMIVSPFNTDQGLYSFRLKIENESLSIGVALRQNDKAILNTWYNCKRMNTSSLQIIKLAILKPIMTLKVMVAIHFEAAKLWLKGLRPPNRQKAISPKQK